MPPRPDAAEGEAGEGPRGPNGPHDPQGPNGPHRPRLTPARRRRRLLAALVVLTVLAGGSTWLVYGSPLLRAEHVTVRGDGQLTDDQIIAAAAVPLGGPLVSVDTGAVRARLLKALPRISAAQVTRSWPHTIRLKVIERTPSAVLKSGARYTEVDGDGVRFATVDRVPRGVPLVQLAGHRPVALRQFGTKELLRAAIAVSGDLPETLHGQATAIRVGSYDAITVELSGGRAVMWGSAENGAEKAAVLTALMKAQPDATHFDVSAPNAPAASGS